MSCAKTQSDRLSGTKLVCRYNLILMDMFSPCQGRLQTSAACQSGPSDCRGRYEKCRKIRLLQVDMNPANLCDPQLIDLLGAKGHGPEQELFSSFLPFPMSAENMETGGALR